MRVRPRIGPEDPFVARLGSTRDQRAPGWFSQDRAHLPARPNAEGRRGPTLLDANQVSGAEILQLLGRVVGLMQVVADLDPVPLVVELEEPEFRQPGRRPAVLPRHLARFAVFDVPAGDQLAAAKAVLQV